jgi:hypothetical protein
VDEEVEGASGASDIDIMDEDMPKEDANGLEKAGSYAEEKAGGHAEEADPDEDAIEDEASIANGSVDE